MFFDVNRGSNPSPSASIPLLQNLVILTDIVFPIKAVEVIYTRPDGQHEGNIDQDRSYHMEIDGNDDAVGVVNHQGNDRGKLEDSLKLPHWAWLEGRIPRLCGCP